MKKATIKAVDAINDDLAIRTSHERLNRASSVTVGTSFNGVTELMIRGGSNFLWAPLQPTEVIELIHQLAAGVGCHIHIQPRNDFASWREWRETPDIAPFRSAGLAFAPHANHPPSLELQQSNSIKGESNEQTVATQKTVGRKRAKRAAAAA